MTKNIGYLPNDQPAFGKLVLLSLQHVLTMFPDGPGCIDYGLPRFYGAFDRWFGHSRSAAALEMAHRKIHSAVLWLQFQLYCCLHVHHPIHRCGFWHASQ